MKFRRFIMLAALLVLVVAAGAQTVTITYWQYAYESKVKLMDELIKGFEKANPGIKKIRIEGHTDSRGARDMNMKLSSDRAASCRQYLIDHGVDAGRLASEGLGPDKPIDDNKTEPGRQKNRRVEVKQLM